MTLDKSTWGVNLRSIV